jgi:hypothetical protein
MSDNQVANTFTKMYATSLIARMVRNAACGNPDKLSLDDCDREKADWSLMILAVADRATNECNTQLVPGLILGLPQYKETFKVEFDRGVAKLNELHFSKSAPFCAYVEKAIPSFIAH